MLKEKNNMGFKNKHELLSPKYKVETQTELYYFQKATNFLKVIKQQATKIAELQELLVAARAQSKDQIWITIKGTETFDKQRKQINKLLAEKESLQKALKEFTNKLKPDETK